MLYYMGVSRCEQSQGLGFRVRFHEDCPVRCSFEPQEMFWAGVSEYETQSCFLWHLTVTLQKAALNLNPFWSLHGYDLDVRLEV